MDRPRIDVRRLAATTVIGAAVALAGCAAGPRIVHTEVTTFDAWPTLPADRSYVFSPTLEFQSSLELRSYENLVRDELAERGFHLAADPPQANLVVTLRPSVTGTSVRVAGWPGDPFWGPYVGAYGGAYGRFYGGWYGPFWPGYDAAAFGGYTIDVYKRRLELDIDSRTTPGKRYYEGRAESTGDDDALPRAVPVLIRALFTDFPGNNGQTRRVDIAVDPRVRGAQVGR